jgi:hypothetical protein
MLRLAVGVVALALGDVAGGDRGFDDPPGVVADR